MGRDFQAEVSNFEDYRPLKHKDNFCKSENLQKYFLQKFEYFIMIMNDKHQQVMIKTKLRISYIYFI